MSKSVYPGFGILLVDDELPFLRSLSITLERLGGISNLHTCNDSRQAMSMIEQHDIRIVLLDLTMPHVSGEELLGHIEQQYPQIDVIIISGLNQLETAVKCLRMGAYDYFVKTTEQERLVEGVSRAILKQEMLLENNQMRDRLLNDTLVNDAAFADIITADKSMRSVFQYLEAVSVSSQPVLIGGESGVGKELIAQALHQLSNAEGPLVTVNVAGLDDNVFADTLFGHKRGAFTSADSNRSGLVEQAANGTLFLDEIGDLSLASQVKLLRLLQEGEYLPLGGDRPKRLKARVIVATHQNLAEKQQAGEFRRDLYYRLNTHHVQIPPLRERKGDIGLLLKHFVRQAAEEMSKEVPLIPPQVLALLGNYAFPGNVREVKALAFDAVSRQQGRSLNMDAFNRLLDKDVSSLPEAATEATLFSQDQPLPTLQEIADMLVQEAMQRSNNNQSLAARMLGISQPALSKRLKKQGSTEV